MQSPKMFRTPLAFWVYFISILGNVEISFCTEISPNTKVENQLDGITETTFKSKQNDEDIKSLLQNIGRDLRKELSNIQEESNRRYDQLDARVSNVLSRFDKVELAISQVGKPEWRLPVKKSRSRRSSDCDTFALKNILDDLSDQAKLKFNAIDNQLKEAYELGLRISNRTEQVKSQLLQSEISQLNEASKLGLRISNSTEQVKSQLDTIQSEISQAKQILVTSSIELGCKGIINQNHTKNKVYIIRTSNAQPNFREQAYCDMVDDGGGWTIIQRRGVRDIPKAQRENFNRSWIEYENGFGSPNDDHWIGLKHIHTLTKDCANELKVTLTAWNGTQFYAKYSNFQISGNWYDYRLTIGDFTAGTLGHSRNNHMDYNNGMKFTTFDKDNDKWSGTNCAVSYGGAWWHNSLCSRVALNGEYAGDGTNGRVKSLYTGIYWYPDGYDWNFYSFKKSEMKIRSKC